MSPPDSPSTPPPAPAGPQEKSIANSDPGGQSTAPSTRAARPPRVTTTPRRKPTEKWADLPVKFLVMSTDDFIVFLDQEHDIDWKTTSEYDEATPHSDAFQSILNRVADLESRDNASLSEKFRIAYRRMLAEGLARSLAGSLDAANQALDQAERFFERHCLGIARVSYARAAALACGFVLLVSLVVWLLRSYSEPALGGVLFALFICAGAGALGALLSILLKIRALALDHLADPSLHVAEARIRIGVGALGAILAALAVRSNLLLPQLNSVDGVGGLVLACLLAGASERLVPNLISRLDQDRGADS